MKTQFLDLKFAFPYPDISFFALIYFFMVVFYYGEFFCLLFLYFNKKK